MFWYCVDISTAVKTKKVSNIPFEVNNYKMHPQRLSSCWYNSSCWVVKNISIF